MLGNIDAKPTTGRQLRLINTVVDCRVSFRSAHEIKRWPEARHFDEGNCVTFCVSCQKIWSPAGMPAHRMNFNGVTLPFKSCVHQEFRKCGLVSQGACFPETCDCLRALIFRIFRNPFVQLCSVDIIGSSGDGIVECELVFARLFGVRPGTFLFLKYHLVPVRPRRSCER
jgi:hypothetical protein